MNAKGTLATHWKAQLKEQWIHAAPWQQALARSCVTGIAVCVCVKHKPAEPSPAQSEGRRAMAGNKTERKPWTFTFQAELLNHHWQTLDCFLGCFMERSVEHEKKRCQQKDFHCP
jgi:hypothetical protein